MCFRPERVFHVDLEGSVVLIVSGHDGQPGDVAVVVAGHAVQGVRLVSAVAGARSEDQLVHLPPDLRPGLPAHLHLHVGVRPGRRLESGLGVEVQPRRSSHSQVDGGGLSDLLLAPDEVVGGADVLPVILDTTLSEGGRGGGD